MLDNYGPNQLKVKHIYVHGHAYNAYVRTYTYIFAYVCVLCVYVCVWGGVGACIYLQICVH